MGIIDRLLIKNKLSERPLTENSPFLTRRAEILHNKLMSELEVSVKQIDVAIISFNNSASTMPTHETINVQTNIRVFKINAQREALVAAMAVDHEIIRLLKENPE